MSLLLGSEAPLPEVEIASPELNLAPRDIEGLLAELREYHAIFSPLFYRKEQGHWALKYMEGLLLDIEHKAVEPMADALEGGNVRAMQQFLGQGAWEDSVILRVHRREVAYTLGTGDGVLLVDGSDFPKQGTESVGVARQWCGALGKVDNCQAGVFVGYASSQGHTLVDARVYLPAQWFTEEYAQRRKRCGVPEDVSFHTKPELAWEMVEEIVAEGALPFSWITFDEGYGDNPLFLERLEGLGLRYLAEVSCDTLVWKDRPETYVPPPPPRGRPPSRERLRPEAPRAERVDEIAASLPPEAWSRWIVKEGSKGPIVAEFAALRVVGCRDQLPGPEQWVILRRTLGEKPVLKYYLSNAPEDIPLSEMVWVSGMRWPIETTFEEGKGELGMDQYETRSWRGWHHHMTLTMLAHHFLVRLRLRLQDKAPALTVPQVRLLLRAVLPKKTFDADAALDLVHRIQHRNHAAYLSHRKRKCQQIDAL